MRRKDRQITDSSRIQGIIDQCTCCRIGFNDNGEVYNEKVLAAVAVFKIEVTNLSCKEHK